MSLGGNEERGVKQQFTAEVGAEYRFSFYYKASTQPPPGATCIITSVYGDENNFKEVNAAADSDYHYYSVLFTSGIVHPAIQLKVSCSYTVGSYLATFIFDDAALYKVNGGCDLPAEPQDPVVPEAPPGCDSNMVGTPGFEHYDQSDMPWRGSNWGTQAQGPEDDPNSRRAYSGEWLRYVFNPICVSSRPIG